MGNEEKKEANKRRERERERSVRDRLRAAFFFFVANWCKIAPKKIKMKNILSYILENFAKFDHTPKNHSPDGIDRLVLN